ncbi:hypothetical protein Gotur_029070 [Gossypium turneri]
MGDDAKWKLLVKKVLSAKAISSIALATPKRKREDELRETMDTHHQRSENKAVWILVCKFMTFKVVLQKKWIVKEKRKESFRLMHVVQTEKAIHQRF